MVNGRSPGFVGKMTQPFLNNKLVRTELEIGGYSDGFLALLHANHFSGYFPQRITEPLAAAEG